MSSVSPRHCHSLGICKLNFQLPTSNFMPTPTFLGLPLMCFSFCAFTSLLQSNNPQFHIGLAGFLRLIFVVDDKIYTKCLRRHEWFYHYDRFKLLSCCCCFVALSKNFILISHFDLMPFNMKNAENKTMKQNDCYDTLILMCCLLSSCVASFFYFVRWKHLTAVHVQIYTLWLLEIVWLRHRQRME